MIYRTLHIAARNRVRGFAHSVLFTACSAMLCASCQSSAPASQADVHAYFDLARLVQKDISDNSEKACGEMKTVYVNTTGETKQLDSINWQKELQPILDCDINKAAWFGKFQVDTFHNEPGAMTIQYHSMSDKIPVRSMSVLIRNNTVQRVLILKRTRSFIFTSEQQIAYIPEKGFSVRGEQRAVMMKNFELNVDASYNCK